MMNEFLMSDLDFFDTEFSCNDAIRGGIKGWEDWSDKLGNIEQLQHDFLNALRQEILSQTSEKDFAKPVIVKTETVSAVSVP